MTRWIAVSVIFGAALLMAQEHDHVRSDDHGASRSSAILLPQYFGARSALFFQPPNAPPNKLPVMPFHVERDAYVSHARRQVITASIGGNAFACIYDRRKKLLTEFIISTSEEKTVDIELSTPLVLRRDRQYFLAAGADNIIAQGADYLFDSEAMNAIGWLDSAELTDHCPEQLGEPIGVWPYSAPWVVLYDKLPFDQQKGPSVTMEP